jgi:hypothetical protein
MNISIILPKAVAAGKDPMGLAELVIIYLLSMNSYETITQIDIAEREQE